ncbi:MAG: transaldolase [Solirubrobacterales bacterium]
MSGRLLLLHREQGQSPWIDNLTRTDITSGRLEGLIARGVRGLTSNPTIFQKAIQGSDAYDEQLSRELAVSPDVRRAYWELVLADIHGALDTFESLHRSSGGTDGFVSVEVDPSLARDGAATLAAARALHTRINRGHAMIKIPATIEGLPAIRTMIAEGRNVNVTLIVSLERYDAVIEAYIAGLEDRAAAGEPVSGVASVASFFISRVDTEIDTRLRVLGGAALDLCGTAAVNHAKLAYDLAMTRFSGPRWQRLADLGAAPQRPLWASTSTKNPAYPDTRYVDALIGPGTVNTLPETTLEAFDDHGTCGRTIDIDIDEARRQWARLAEVGVDVADVATVLEDEGVASFVASFDDLISSLQAKADSRS